jgi:hypothetical protein
VDGARVLIPSTGTIYQELETFYEDVIATGRRIRLYPDRTVNTSSDYITVIVANGEGDVPAFDDLATWRFRGYDGLCDVTIPVVKYV